QRRSPRQRRRPFDGNISVHPDTGGLLPLSAAVLPRSRRTAGTPTDGFRFVARAKNGSFLALCKYAEYEWIEVERLGGLCLPVKREVLRKMGVNQSLREWTDLQLFDTDILSSKARQAGYSLACCRDLFVHHFGSRIFAHGAPKELAQSK